METESFNWKCQKQCQQKTLEKDYGDTEGQFLHLFARHLRQQFLAYGTSFHAYVLANMPCIFH